MMEDHLTSLIRRRMQARSLSLRALARLAGVEHSTLSRMLRGKSQPSVSLLAAIAPHLQLPLPELLQQAGLRPLHAPATEAFPLHSLRQLGLDPRVDTTVVAAQLERLREYAGTTEAQRLAAEGLDRKIEELGARGPAIDHLRGLATIYLDPDEPTPVRAAAGSAVLYFLLAVDHIDDYLFPIGYLDDAVAIAIAEADIARLRAGG